MVVEIEVSKNVTWIYSRKMSVSSPETAPKDPDGRRTPSPTFSGTSSIESADSGFDSVEQELAELHEDSKNAAPEYIKESDFNNVSSDIEEKGRKGGRPKSPNDESKVERQWKQCELCDRAFSHSFAKHMNSVHLARFCLTCREYLPIEEEKEHKRLHAEPSYKGKKIR